MLFNITLFLILIWTPAYAAQPTTEKTAATTTIWSTFSTTIPICRPPQLKDGEFIENRLGAKGPWTNTAENLIIKCKPGYISTTYSGVMACMRGNWVIHRDTGCLLAPATTTSSMTPGLQWDEGTVSICRPPHLKDGEFIEKRIRHSGPWTNYVENLIIKCKPGYQSTIYSGVIGCVKGAWARYRDIVCIPAPTTTTTTTYTTTVKPTTQAAPTTTPTTTTISTTTAPTTTSAICRAPSLKDGEIIETRSGQLNGMWTNAFETLTLRCGNGYTSITPFGFLTCTYGNWVRQLDPGCIRVTTTTSTTTTTTVLPTTPGVMQSMQPPSAQLTHPGYGMATGVMQSMQPPSAKPTHPGYGMATGVMQPVQPPTSSPANTENRMPTESEMLLSLRRLQIRSTSLEQWLLFPRERFTGGDMKVLRRALCDLRQTLPERTRYVMEELRLSMSEMTAMSMLSPAMTMQVVKLLRNMPAYIRGTTRMTYNPRLATTPTPTPR